MSRANPRFRRQNPKLPTPTSNVYRVRLLGQVEFQLTSNSFYFFDGNPFASTTLTNLQNLSTAIGAAGSLIPKYAAAISADWHLTNYIIDSPTSPTLAALNVSQITLGGGPAGHEPTEVAAPFIRYSTVKGQCGRGRFSLPAVPTGWVSASNTNNNTAYNALAAEVLVNLTGGADTFHPCIFSRNGSRAFPGIGVAALSACTYSTLLGTIRRRKIGRGK